MDESLARLQTDRIDLYYAHKDDGSVGVEETVRAFDQTVRDGKVLHVAASNVPPDRLVESLELGRARGPRRLPWLQPHYNLVEREGYERDYAPIVARARAVAWRRTTRSRRGFLTGKYRNGSRRQPARGAWRSQYLDERGRARPRRAGRGRAAHGVTPAAVAIAWLRAKPGVVAPIASARTPEQLADPARDLHARPRARSPNSTRPRA